jgi:hypothetical protein
MRKLFCASSDEFIESIKADLDQGYGFVPLIGTGVSAPSGVPIIHQVRAYLEWCLWLALPVEHAREHDPRLDPRADRSLDRPWNPRIDAWPALDVSDLSRKDGAELLALLLAQRRTANADDPLIEIVQQALGAAPDWRSSLLFLSRLELDRRTREVALGAPDYRVVDQFFKHILDDKCPTLSHRMLAQLADRMRFHILLTTNFDDLLEQAFTERGSPLTTFDVHLHGQLPAIQLLKGCLAFVKLHGGRHGVRADYSLDADPAADDLRHFVSYLTNRHEFESVARPGGAREVKNHLLVLGTSARDRRIQAMIKHAWQSVPSLKVYWVCHTSRDREEAEKFFREIAPNGSPDGRFVGIHHFWLGFLLLELYQHLHQALPPTGIPFPAAARVSAPPTRPLATDDELAAPEFRRFVERIENAWRSVRSSKGPRLITVASPAGMTGVTSAASQLFQRLADKGSECIWLDLDDVFSTDDLFEQILESITTRVGIPDWVPMVQSTDVKSRAKVLRHATGHLGKEWVLFLNARESPGSNLLYPPPPGTRASVPPEIFDTNGWLDYVPPPVSTSRGPAVAAEDGPHGRAVQLLHEILISGKLGDDTSTREAFLRLLPEITGESCPNVSCILLCRKPPSPQAGNDLLADLNRNGFTHQIVLEQSLTSDAEEIGAGIADLATAEWMPFLLPLVLMRRTRYLATIAAARFVETSEQNWDVAIQKLKTLESQARGLVRRKPGGFMWMHCRFRDQVREEYRRAHLVRGKAGRRAWERRLQDTHWSLAEWCERLHLATQSPSAAFEAIYFALQSAEAALRAAEFARSRNYQRVAEHLRRVFSLAERALVEADTRIMYLGFSKGRCRRLVQIRDVYVERVRALAMGLPPGQRSLRASVLEACFGLQRKCLEIKAKVAREVSEHRKGYERQRQLRHLLARREPGGERVREDQHAEVRKLFDEKVKAHHPVTWSDWWRHVGTLGTASRSYQEAWSSFQRVLEYYDCADARPDEVVQRVRNRCQRGKEDLECLAVAKVFVRQVQLDLAMCKLAKRMGKRNNARSAKRQALQDYERARELLGVVSTNHWHGVRNNWRRIEMYRAVIETLDPDQVPDFGIARRYLNSAERHMLQFDPGRTSLPFAVIELHRADVSISDALSRPVDEQEGMRFGEFRTELLDLTVDAQLPRAAENDLVRSVVRKLSPRCACEIQAAIDYAQAALDRARPILLRNERNVWWSTWYFERRMKVIELFLWSTLGESRTEIPFLGLEAAPSITRTIVDELLDDAERMVRFDVYRLATVVDCYLSCWRALQIRLACDSDPRADRLLARQKDMLRRLLDIKAVLHEVMKARLRIPRQTEFLARGKLDRDVAKYVRSVCQSVDAAVERYTGPVR